MDLKRETAISLIHIDYFQKLTTRKPQHLTNILIW